MRCLGTLEFLCDFYERCHYTQKKLKLEQTGSDTIDILGTPKTICPRKNSDVDSDKENALPPVSVIKRKIKSPKNCLAKNENDEVSPIYGKSEKTLRAGNLTYKVERGGKTTSVLSILPTFSNVHAYDKQSTVNKSVLQTEPPPIIGASFEENSNSVVTLSKNKKFEYRRGSRGRGRGKGRKILETRITKSEKSYLKTAHRKQRNIFDESPVCDRKRLPCTIDTERNTNITRLKAMAELHSKEAEHADNIKAIDVDTLSCALYSSLPEEEKNPLSTSKMFVDSITTVEIDNSFNIRLNNLETETNSKGGQPIMIIVKQERPENESIQLANQSALASTPSTELLMQEPSKPKIREETLANTSPPPGDEAEFIDSSSTQSNPDTDCLNSGGVIVIKSFIPPQDDTMRDLDKVKSVEERELFTEPSVAIKAGDEDSISVPAGRRNSKESSFGKVSELISNEQKLAIETYYKVDMSMVDTEMVLKNLTVVDRKSIRCNICSLVYPRMDKCQVHVWSHLNMKPYKCKRCDFSTVTVSNVRCHIRKSHLKIKPFACHVCEKRYVTAVLLEEHLNTHTGARPFKCKLCDFASASRQVLSYHKTTHKLTKDINCKICGKDFFSRGRLRAHMFVHNKDKAVVCKLCSSYLSNNEALEMHHRKIHACDYICNICNKRFKSRKALHNHENVHVAAKYKCSLCPNVYKSKHILKEHLLKHEGIRKYKCPVCEKSFAQQSHLAAHMAVHSEIRFNCPGCQRAFNRHDNMKVHTKRCESFQSNPELKELLVRREKSKSSNQKNSTNTIASNVVDSPTSTINVEEKSIIMNLVDKEDLRPESTINDCNIYQPRNTVIEEL